MLQLAYPLAPSRRRHFILGVVLLLIAYTASGQQFPGFSMQLHDGGLFQPARMGLSEDRIDLRFRNQWLGMDQRYTPMSFFALGDLTQTLRLKADRIGLGFGMLGDRAFIQRSFFGHLHFAYHLIQREDLGISAGIMAGLLSQSMDFSDTRLYDPFDLAVLDGRSSATGFSGGFGLHLQHRRPNGDRVEADLVLPQLFNSNLQFAEGLRYNPVPHLQLGGGYRLHADLPIQLEPRMLWRALLIDGAWHSTLDLGLRAFLLDERYWAGLGFRVPGGAFHLALGAKLNEKIQFDALMETQSQLGFSFELGFSYRLGARSPEKEDVAEAPAPAPAVQKALRDSLLNAFEQNRQQAIRSLRSAYEQVQELGPRLNRLEGLLIAVAPPSTPLEDRRLVVEEVGRRMENLIPELNQLGQAARQAEIALAEADTAYERLREMGDRLQGAGGQLRLLRRTSRQSIKRTTRMLDQYDEIAERLEELDAGE